MAPPLTSIQIDCFPYIAYFREPHKLIFCLAALYLFGGRMISHYQRVQDQKNSESYDHRIIMKSLEKIIFLHNATMTLENKIMNLWNYTFIHMESEWKLLNEQMDELKPALKDLAEEFSDYGFDSNSITLEHRQFFTTLIFQKNSNLGEKTQHLVNNISKCWNSNFKTPDGHTLKDIIIEENSKHDAVLSDARPYYVNLITSGFLFLFWEKHKIPSDPDLFQMKTLLDFYNMFEELQRMETGDNVEPTNTDRWMDYSPTAVYFPILYSKTKKITAFQLQFRRIKLYDIPRAYLDHQTSFQQYSAFIDSTVHKINYRKRQIFNHLYGEVVPRFKTLIHNLETEFGLQWTHFSRRIETVDDVYNEI